MDIRIGSSSALADFTATQLQSLYPNGGKEKDVEVMEASIPEALRRIEPILNAVRNFEKNSFNHFHSLQYATFLYLLGNQIWLERGHNALSERLFCLNRSLNCIDLFYSVEMPRIFFLSHAIGAVLGGAQYGENLVIFQNVTVGRVGNARPTVGDNVVLYPGAIVTGASTIGSNSVVGAGVVVSGVNVPSDSVVRMIDGKVHISERTRDYRSLYFR